MPYKLLLISKQFFWSILEKFHFIILLTSYGISSKILNLLFTALSAHSLCLKVKFSIQMGLKTKQHSGLSRNIKSFTLNSILLYKINYMLLFKLFSLHPYPINIVSDSLYCFHIKKYRNLHHKLQSTCYSTTLSNYNLLLETAILPFILHIFEHIPAFLAP